MPEIIMPKAGDAMTEGKVVRWYKQPGDPVKRGEAVAEIETDKVNLDLEAEEDGTLGAHAAKEGDMVPVGNVLARILKEGEKDDAPKAQPKAEEKPEPKPEPKAESREDEPPLRRSTDRKESVKHTTGEYQEAIEQRGPRRDRSAPEAADTAEAPQGESGDRKRSSPLARRMAREMGVNIESVQGSGPRGRVVAADIKNAGSQPAPAPKSAPAAQ